MGALGLKAAACAVAAVVATVLGGCRHRCPPSASGPLHRPPPLGRRLLVVAPHPDDEVLAAGGLMARILRQPGTVHVVVATDGEAGVNRTRAPDLGDARRGETRRALADLGLAPADVEFLGYANNSLANAWGKRWRAARRGADETSSGALVEALRGALRAAAPDTIVLPMSLDEHVDHYALGRFALLALLGEAPVPRPTVLGYLVHGKGRWPACGSIGLRSVPPLPPGCAALFPWTGLPVDRTFKAGLIREYRTQLGATLLRHARAIESFAGGLVVEPGRPAAAWRPGVRPGADRIAILVPRTPCLVDPAAGDRLRLRYFRDGVLDERLVTLAPAVDVRGGPPGGELVPARDVQVAVRRDTVHVVLDMASFRDVGGAVLEVVAGERREAPAWLLRWS